MSDFGIACLIGGVIGFGLSIIWKNPVGLVIGIMIAYILYKGVLA